MDHSPPVPAQIWFLRGVRELASVHAVVLMGAQVGFAALCRELGVTLGEAIALSVLVWALPSQIVYVTLASAGASYVAIVLAVSLSALRFLPMVMTWTPMVRTDATKRVSLFAVSMVVTITSWVFAVSHLEGTPRSGRLAFFAGFSIGLMLINAAMVAFAYVAIAALPPIAGVMMAYLMPIYFLLALTDGARTRTDALALAAGLFGLPIAAWILPDMDILLAGVIGGTLAYLLGRFFPKREAA